MQSGPRLISRMVRHTCSKNDELAWACTATGARDAPWAAAGIATAPMPPAASRATVAPASDNFALVEKSFNSASPYLESFLNPLYSWRRFIPYRGV